MHTILANGNEVNILSLLAISWQPFIEYHLRFGKRWDLEEIAICLGSLKQFKKEAKEFMVKCNFATKIQGGTSLV